MSAPSKSQQALDQINEQRIANGQPPLSAQEFNSSLEAAADKITSQNTIPQFLLAIAVAAAVTGGLFMTFLPKKDGGEGVKVRADSPNPDSERGFAASTDHFQGAHEALSGVGPSQGWTGDSGTRHGEQNAAFTAQVRQVGRASQDVDATVQTQAEQVTSGKETLTNLLNGLQAAVPISQSLYFSGPAGPAMSYQFQLAVATPAVSTASDTTNGMHANAQQHAQRLTELTQHYDAAFRLISATDPSTPLTPVSSASTTAMAADPEYIKSLAPCHQQAADRFDSATNTVSGSAATISANHGLVCNASEGALQAAEEAHTRLAAAMHQHSASLAAALPAAASAYAGTDESAAKKLNHQLV